MVKRNTTLTILVAFGLVTGLFAFAFLIGGQGNFVTGNVIPLSFTTEFREFNCDAFNQLAITKDGTKSVVGSGKKGFQNLDFDIVDTASLLSLTDAGGSEVDALHFQLVLDCGGNWIKYSAPEFGGATVLSGSFNIKLCASPSTGAETCLIGEERNFQQINGIALSTETFTNVPLTQQPLFDDVTKLIWEGDMSAGFIETLFSPNTSLHFQSEMFPVLTFTFLCIHPNCPMQGTFTTTYNAITANQPIIAQYGGLQIADVDTDGDGILDNADGCINQPETFNGFEDADGCPDEVPPDVQQIIQSPDTPLPPPSDVDQDGIPDTIDEDPTTLQVSVDDQPITFGTTPLPPELEADPIITVITTFVDAPTDELEVTQLDIIILLVIFTIVALIVLGLLRRFKKI